MADLEFGSVADKELDCRGSVADAVVMQSPAETCMDGGQKARKLRVRLPTVCTACVCVCVCVCMGVCVCVCVCVCVYVCVHNYA